MVVDNTVMEGAMLLKNVYNHVAYLIVILLCITLTSCKKVTRYGEFFIDDISSYDAADYLSDEKFAYLRIDGIAIIPQIKCYTHSYYRLDLILYSTNPNAAVTVDSISIYKDDKIIFTDQSCHELTASKSYEDIYSGDAVITSIAAANIDEYDRANYVLKMTVSCGDSTTKKKEITYSAVVKQYWVWLMQ